MEQKVFRWSEIYYQPKLTYVLKNTNPAYFQQIGKHFESILGYQVQVYCNRSDKERWTVSFNGYGEGSSLRLILYLHDPSEKTYGAADLEIHQPTVEIVDFIMNPKGHGLGSKVIQALINDVEKIEDGFVMMMLWAQGERAANFWRKVGFTEVWDGSVSMVRPLQKSEKEKKVSVNINASSEKEKRVINSYDIKSI
ncbi:GNAT family N-acetyltransferase [Brevibacillus parabrevis]|uniref:GNAT family N-acetyltransferase n=1 Tax=Brevibacillus parabrevis TaxID=54914 RepID=UPI003D2417E9